MAKFVTAFHGHFKKEAGVEERFHDWSRHFEPATVIRHGERLTGTFRHYLEKPRVQLSFRSQGPQLFYDPESGLLQTVDLKALMIEAINGIFITPHAGVLSPQFF